MLVDSTRKESAFRFAIQDRADLVLRDQSRSRRRIPATTTNGQVQCARAGGIGVGLHTPAAAMGRAGNAHRSKTSWRAGRHAALPRVGARACALARDGASAAAAGMALPSSVREPRPLRSWRARRRSCSSVRHGSFGRELGG